MKEVIDYYNGGQDFYRIPNRNKQIYESADKHSAWRVEITSTMDDEPCMNIGFYEWLFNPKYKVFEVFKLGRADSEEIFNVSWVYNYTTKQPKEIMLYLKDKIKEV